jgi:hypothetical protein
MSIYVQPPLPHDSILIDAVSRHLRTAIKEELMLVAEEVVNKVIDELEGTLEIRAKAFHDISAWADRLIIEVRDKRENQK